MLPSDVRARLTKKTDSPVKGWAQTVELIGPCALVRFVGKPDDEKLVPRFDFATMTSPCADFSAMGKQKGADGPTASCLVTGAKLLIDSNVMFFY